MKLFIVLTALGIHFTCLAQDSSLDHLSYNSPVYEGIHLYDYYDIQKNRLTYSLSSAYMDENTNFDTQLPVGEELAQSQAVEKRTKVLFLRWLTARHMTAALSESDVMRVPEMELGYLSTRYQGSMVYNLNSGAEAHHHTFITSALLTEDGVEKRAVCRLSIEINPEGGIYAGMFEVILSECKMTNLQNNEQIIDSNVGMTIGNDTYSMRISPYTIKKESAAEVDQSQSTGASEQ